MFESMKLRQLIEKSIVNDNNNEYKCIHVGYV